MEQQKDRSSFDKLDSDPSFGFKQKVVDWIEKWLEKIHRNWTEFIKSNNSQGSKMYGMVKTDKVDNPVCVITSGCNFPIKNLSILVEKTLYTIADKLPSKIKDIEDILKVS